MTTQTEAKERVAAVLPHLLCALEEAASGGKKAIITISAQNTDGSGKMILTMNDPLEFVRDIADVAAVSTDITDEARSEYKAHRFFSPFERLKRGFVL